MDLGVSLKVGPLSRGPLSAVTFPSPHRGPFREVPSLLLQRKWQRLGTVRLAAGGRGVGGKWMGVRQRAGGSVDSPSTLFVSAIRRLGMAVLDGGESTGMLFDVAVATHSGHSPCDPCLPVAG